MLISTRRVAVAAALSAMIAVSGCQGSKTPTDDGIRYVALGDSAVAGAGITTSDEKPCLRSDRNYPSLVADQLGVGDFVDVSCPGATTDDVLYGQTQPDGEPTPPQIEEVTADTDVVTISIGGNDEQYVPRLFGGCYLVPDNTPAACKAAVAAVGPLLPTIQSNIGLVLAEIKKRAPSAQIVMVTYLRIAPDSGTCKALDIGGADLRAAAAAEAALATTMQAAAVEAGIDVLPMREASKGHDACAGKDDAWTNAIDVEPGDGTYLHPRAVGAEAVATALAPVVERRLTAP